VATRHTYASTDDLRDYLAGTSFSSGWTSDAGSIRRILEASSRRIDLFCEGGTFGPLTETRYYDIGSGSLVQSPQYAVLAGVNDISTSVALANVIPLDGWLVSTTTVTAYDDTDRAGSTVLTEGHANDFFLMPYNVSPKTIFKLNEDTSNTLDAGQQTLSILAEWGYTSDTLSVTTADAIGSTTTTSVSVTSATDLGPAQTILVDSEQLYITAISGNTLTVERGVNGTTGATHSGGAALTRYDYGELVVQACLDIAKLTFRNRDLGTVGSIGSGDMSMTVAEGEVRSVLMTLADYRVTGTSNGIIF
jgi:hypothetical protein